MKSKRVEFSPKDRPLVMNTITREKIREIRSLYLSDDNKKFSKEYRLGFNFALVLIVGTIMNTLEKIKK